MSTNDPDSDTDGGEDVQPWQVQRSRDDLREQGFDVPRGRRPILDWLEETAGDVADALSSDESDEEGEEDPAEGPDETDEGGHVEVGTDSEESEDDAEEAVEEAAFDDESGEDE